MSKKKHGTVYLIGVGPGDLELLTLRAVRMIGEADLLLLDHLVNQEVVKFAKPGATVAYVGKHVGCPSISQAQIHDHMVAAARSGLLVARLKGGDPFIFGRGGEELAIMMEAGIEVCVANGISAGIAAPACLGIPLSHRDYAHSVTFITGHNAGSEHLDWAGLAKVGGTLVVYMGIKNVETIVENLLEHGLCGETLAAVIERATLPDERTIVTTLKNLPTTVRKEEIESPAILVIGRVVEFASLSKRSIEAAPVPLEIA